MIDHRYSKSPPSLPACGRQWIRATRYYLFLIAALVWGSSFTICLAQNSVSDRAAEWKSHALPTSEFNRLVDEENGVILRVPASWKKEEVATPKGQEKSYRFNGPYSAMLQVSIGKIPNGLPLQSYTAEILQQLRNLPGSADSLTTRQTEMSGLEAREIMFELPDENGVQTRRLIWCTVDGPVAVAVIFIEPENHIAEIEPYLRAVIQSLTIHGDENITAFEAERTASIKESKPTRIDEVQSIAANLNGLDAGLRDAGVNRLSALFVTAPEVGIDLILDRRPIIRAATVDSIARSANHLLDPFLMRALHDPESFVAERAARALVARPNIVALMRNETLGWLSTEPLSRVWPFLNRKAQLQILNEGFAQQTGPATITARRSPGARPTKAVDPDPSGQLGLLTLLVDIPAQDFKLPLTTILKAQSEALTAAALQVALSRRESLPFTDLFKLLSSSGMEVRKMAARNLGESGTVANIGQLEEFASLLSGQLAGSVRASTSDKAQPDADGNALATELRITIRKIRLRNDLSSATSERKSQLIADTLKDPQLAEWVWMRYVNTPAVESDSQVGPATLSLAPFGENAFPQQMTHYVSIPNPATVVDKLGTSLNSIQMDSARAQANLVLVLSGLSRLLGQQLGAPLDGPVLEYSGIKTSAPMSFGSWISAGAPAGVADAQRKAIVLHVSDHDRFERSLAFYQREVGSFSSLPDGVAAGARFLAVLPAVFPMSANMISQDLPRSNSAPILKYDFAGRTVVNGYPVKWFAVRRVSAQGTITNDAAYLTYVGEAALLTPDLASMRDVLQRIHDGGPSLNQNRQFKIARDNGGEAFYFSNLTELFGQTGAKDEFHINESGALQISNSNWESSYHVSFDDSSWSKLLIAFNPSELAAPRDLLPRSTVLYYFMKLDGAELLRTWGKAATTAEMKSLTDAWVVDFEKDVMPEIDSECGVALLDLADSASWQGHWAVFFKLKSDRLQRALEEGRLFKGATVNKGIATLKLDSSSFYAQVKNNFLVVSDAPESLALLDQKEKLSTSPDFAKAMGRSPGGVVAFGGYNLEAAGVLAGVNPDSVKAQQANMILSLVRAFHSPSLYATIKGNDVDARSSISMDREGRYSVAELQSLTANSEPTFAILRPRGLAIVDQSHLDSLRLRIKAKAAGEMERIAEDLASSSQTVEQRSEQELQVQILPRRAEPKQRLQLPITAHEVSAYLTPSKEIPADDKSVADKAREIAGADRDAWSVATKLAKWTFENLKWKRVDYADAAQTLATREADCYEFSKLYVAMARSLGLPARVVSGFAYSGGSFGGHAWVEVYVGDWIEIDPTWGTSFVDATHIKDSTGALLTYAALNLVQVEVVDAAHSVAAYQKNPIALAKKICEELSEGKSDALRSGFDVSAVTDELMGAGSWSAMTDKERDQISASSDRVLNSIAGWLSSNGKAESSLRLLKVRTTENRAEATAMFTEAFTDDFLKLVLVKRGDAWVLVEVTEVDTGLKMISENLQPTINEIRDRRNGKQHQSAAQTEFARVLITMEKNNQAALDLVDGLLKANPKDQALRYLRSLCLAYADKEDEAAKVWTELTEEQPPLAPALRKLALHYAGSKEVAERTKAVDLFKRYVSLEPDDPRARTGLAESYERAGDVALAETEYRAAVERDDSNSDVYLDLAQFYAGQKHFSEAVSVLDDAAKRTTDKDDLFASLIGRFWFDENPEVPEGLAASQPQRMAQSAPANLSLARIRIDHDHPREALPLLRKAATLNSKLSDPYDLMAEAFRKLHDWTAALKAADTAIRLGADDSEGYYQRACALARLGRRTEAIAALKRAVELDEDLADSLADEEDLKPLASLPEFKKLLPKENQP